MSQQKRSNLSPHIRCWDIFGLQERLGLEVANAQERQRRAASVGGDGPPMSIREMRKRLSELGLQVSGTRLELEARLAEFARLSAESAREAAQQEALEEDGRARRLDPRAKLLLGYEPSASVAGVCVAFVVGSEVRGCGVCGWF